MLVFDQEWGVSDLAPVWHFVGRWVRYLSGFLGVDYWWVLPQRQQLVQVLHWLLEVLHCPELIAVAELQLLQDFAMDWVCDVEGCSG